MQTLIRGYLSTALLLSVFFVVGLVQNLNTESSFCFLWMQEISIGWFLTFFFLSGSIVGAMIVLLFQTSLLSLKTPELAKFDLDKPL